MGELRRLLQGDFSSLSEDDRREAGEKKVQDEDSAKVIQESTVEVQRVSVLPKY